MNVLAKLTRTEGMLLLRNPTGLFMALGFPAILLLVYGFVIPGTRLPIPDNEDPLYAGLRMIDLIVPVSLTVVIGSVALTNLPAAIGAYRDQGVLRRLGTTPVGPHRLLAAQLIINLVSLVAGALVAMVAAGVALGARLPHSPLLVVISFILSAGALLALGGLIAARAKDAQRANGIGMLIFTASLFTAGLWTPGPLMAEPLRLISSLTPLGAASQAISAGWYGGPTPFRQLAVLLAWTVPLILIAGRTFRWR